MFLRQTPTGNLEPVREVSRASRPGTYRYGGKEYISEPRAARFARPKFRIVRIDPTGAEDELQAVTTRELAEEKAAWLTATKVDPRYSYAVREQSA